MGVSSNFEVNFHAIDSGRLQYSFGNRMRYKLEIVKKVTDTGDMGDVESVYIIYFVI